MRLLLTVWSVIAWTLAFLIMALVFVLTLPFAILGVFHRVQHRGPMQVVGLVPYLTLSRMTRTYDPGFDPDRVSLFVQNHISMLDGHIAIGALQGPFCGVENAAHLNVPFYGWLMRMANAIPVVRGGRGQTSKLTDLARERVSRGISILAFPEGTRTGRTAPARSSWRGTPGSRWCRSPSAASTRSCPRAVGSSHRATSRSTSARRSTPWDWTTTRSARWRIAVG